ncbi:MAG: GDSL-type esterase/lipase family protein [Clostridium sp.]|nr:GDSL-type esterase/lipase family protein [Clostridium sp.]
MRILCLGDSLTYGFGQPRDRVWTTLASAKSGQELVNRGINGNTTGGMLCSLAQELKACRYDAVHLMGGCNDLSYGGDLAGAKANMGAMVHMAAAAHVLPVIGIPVLPCPPVREDWAEWADTLKIRQCRKEYSLWLKQLCRMFHFSMIDFEGEFPGRIAAGGGRLEAYYMEDGLHPNAAGHQVMAEIAVEAIRGFRI